MAFALLQPTRHDVYPFIDPRDGLKGAAAGKTVLVTGGGTGIGRSIAESFALAGAAEVILAARRTEPLQEAKQHITGLVPNCKVSVFGGVDVSQPEAVRKLFASMALAPDVVVSNAAISLATATVEESDPEIWCKEIDVNIKGCYLIAHEYLNTMRKAGKKGCLVNVSSNGSWRYIPGRSSYGGSKAMMNHMTEYIHRESEAAGGLVTCISMHPGGVKTNLAGDDLPEAIKRVLIDTPELPGGTALYLSTERAKFLGGRFILSTWDMEELEKHKERIQEEDLLKTRVLGVHG